MKYSNPVGRRAFLLGATLGLMAISGTAAAQTPYPQRPITFMVPNAAGGPADSLARTFAAEMSRHLGQPVVVENLGGASGALAAQKVVRSSPDGYTLLFGTTSDMVVTPIAISSAGYSTKDFTAITKVGTTPMTLVARGNLGVSNAEELLALARQKPGSLSVGVTGSASLQAFATVALQRAAHIDLVGVPYRGSAPIMNDLLGGQIDLAVMTLPGALPHVQSGKLVMMGVLADKRAALAPDLPTIGETPAFRGVVSEIWAGLAGPAGLPKHVVDKLSQAAKRVLEDASYVELRAKSGDISVPFAPPADFAHFLTSEAARYRELAMGLKLE